ncbi:MAG: hypothetical protein M3N32_01290, partial [Actinomycetota bacterium]|nr:hypothetical protein [Actinomycetota bacterium]
VAEEMEFRVAPLSGLVRSSRTDVAVDHRRWISSGEGRRIAAGQQSLGSVEVPPIGLDRLAG